MFDPHPSRALTALFTKKPHQGATPHEARFLFVGLDANYAPDIEQNPVFPNLLDYHEDGPAFWRRSRVHHPFLLPGYKGDGRRYHLTFAKIGFEPQHADLVSFVELLHLPTVGRSALTPRDLDRSHLVGVRDAMFRGKAQFIFVSAGVQRLLKGTGLFPELERVRGDFGALRVLHDGTDRAVFLHLHFSNYGKFESQLRAEAGEIAQLLARGDA